MAKLKLPILKGPLPDKKWLSMDDYLKFVMFNLQHTVDKKTAASWKGILAVNIPFAIKH